MIVQLTGTLLEVLPTHIVLDVGGVGFELGVSSTTAASLPHVGESGVTVLARMVVRDGSMELYGFASREERALFDQLRAISGVGSKLALAVLSTFSPATLAQVVTTQDAARMAQVPGVGRKKASRLIVELSDVFSKSAELRGLVGLSEPGAASLPLSPSAVGAGVEADATEALLSMGFTSQEAELALEGHAEAGAVTVEQVLAYALRRLGSGR
ncbi:Holliday junction branch migration protein RuvA [Thermophilibacter mediterraneus]|uniref:Holliday junction branch migration protein RuvA n=1 Tax=Thermophilibacter mediterraneus TaxID=1871031 RepID=UPI000931EC6B|nr:Holliday junction branch migration protein RuvA [Thermophilibacter mediterraneus]